MWHLLSVLGIITVLQGLSGPREMTLKLWLCSLQLFTCSTFTVFRPKTGYLRSAHWDTRNTYAAMGTAGDVIYFERKVQYTYLLGCIFYQRCYYLHNCAVHAVNRRTPLRSVQQVRNEIIFYTIIHVNRFIALGVWDNKPKFTSVADGNVDKLARKKMCLW
jgi:hypothetical protein